MDIEFKYGAKSSQNFRVDLAQDVLDVPCDNNNNVWYGYFSDYVDWFGGYENAYDDSLKFCYKSSQRVSNPDIGRCVIKYQSQSGKTGILVKTNIGNESGQPDYLEEFIIKE